MPIEESADALAGVNGILMGSKCNHDGIYDFDHDFDHNGNHKRPTLMRVMPQAAVTIGFLKKVCGQEGDDLC